MDADPVLALADDIQQTKDMLTRIGRQIFRLSSDLAALTPEQLSSFRDIVQTHELLFARAPNVHAQMAEFYKAAVSHIELLQRINEKVLESSGITNHDENGLHL